MTVYEQVLDMAIRVGTQSKDPYDVDQTLPLDFATEIGPRAAPLVDRTPTSSATAMEDLRPHQDASVTLQKPHCDHTVEGRRTRVIDSEIDSRPVKRQRQQQSPELYSPGHAPNSISNLLIWADGAPVDPSASECECDRGNRQLPTPDPSPTTTTDRTEARVEQIAQTPPPATSLSKLLDPVEGRKVGNQRRNGGYPVQVPGKKSLAPHHSRMSSSATAPSIHRLPVLVFPSRIPPDEKAEKGLGQFTVEEPERLRKPPEMVISSKIVGTARYSAAVDQRDFLAAVVKANGLPPLPSAQPARKICSTKSTADKQTTRRKPTPTAAAKRLEFTIDKSAWVQADKLAMIDGRPPIWCMGRQELCESLPYFRAYQGGHYDFREASGRRHVQRRDASELTGQTSIAAGERCYGYLLEGFSAPLDCLKAEGRIIISQSVRGVH